MSLSDVLREQAIGKFKHCYIRYQALLVQLQADAGAGPSPGSEVLLRHLLAAYGGTDGSSCAAAAAAAARLLDPHAHGSVAPGPAFERSYAQEVERLRLFVKSSLEQLWLALLDACAQLRGLSEELLQAGAVAAGRSRQLSARLAELRGGFDATADEVVLMERFVRQNVAACAQLAQMYEQQHHWQGPDGTATSGTAASELPLEAVDGAYLAAAQAALLGELRLEPLVVGLSDAYELCRLVESDAAALAGQPAKWVPPDKFQRVTRKFWLHPADVAAFKARVIRHLPVLIFGDRRKLTEGSPYHVAFLRDQAAVTDSAEVSSVYYDDPAALPSYHDRLRKEDEASVVRLRWYGERRLSPDQRLFVERKVHRERYTGELSYKERAPMAQRHVAAYTGGTGGPPEMLLGGSSGGGSYSQEQLDFLRDTQRFLSQRRQEPLLRTCYRRTAFQESSNNQVRISLDSQLHMVREAGAPRAPGDWCRDMSQPLAGAADAAYFPYAVVEIKLQAAPPDWVQGLLETGMLLPVPKFSKFLHGTALLFQERCRNVPYWFLPDEGDPRRMSPATWEEMADPADEYLQKGASWLFPRDNGGPLEPEPGSPTDPPYRPSPLRFLRRNKTAPAAGGGGGSLSGSGGSGGDHGPAAQEGQGMQLAPTSRPAARTLLAPGQGLQARSLLPPPAAGPYYAAVVAAAAAAAGEATPAGGTMQGAVQGAVQRSTTWPVYQSPPALPPPGAAPGHAGHASQPSAPGQPNGAAAAAAAAAAGGGGRVARSSPAHSQTSTPMDSAQDLEAGQPPAEADEGGAGKGGGKRGGSSKGSGKKRASASAGKPAASSSPAFAALEYRLAAPPAGGSGSGAAAAAPSGRVKALVRTRVEPKTFFANERTFLQWLQISVLIMMTATSLLSGTGMLVSATGASSAAGLSCDASTDKACFASKLSGAIIAPVALLFMAYALAMYRHRTWQILRRETVRYDDQRGPVLLVAILLAVFLLSYILAMVWIF